MKKRWILFLGFTIGIGAFNTSCQSEKKQKVQNIETFTRLYGYARWFHPSDEAQEINWDKFAVLGVQKVENIHSSKQLQDTLYRLFSPIVQGLQIYKTGQHKKPNEDILISPDPNAKPVAWQHYGVYLSERSNIYKSARTNKSKFNINTDAAIMCKVLTDPSQLPNKKVKLSGYFKTKSQNKKSIKLFIQCIQQNDNKIYDTFIDSQTWEKQELTVTIPENTVTVAYGLWILDDSEIGADDFEFFVENNEKWEQTDTVNMGFERGKIDETQSDDWKTLNMQHCSFEVTDKDAHSGKYSLNLSFSFSGKIFEAMPQFGETIDEPIGNNLSCIIPLTLLTNDSATYPKTDELSLAQLKSEIDNIKFNDKFKFSLQTNLASVVIAWNVLQHFFPYFDVVDTDWNKVLGETVKSTLENKRKEDFFITLSKMMAQIEDGHGIVFQEQMHHLPIRTELIEDKIVITASNQSELKKGDIIKKIDGKSAIKALHETEKMISGSAQLRRHRALNILGYKFNASDTQLTIERDNKELTITVPNNYEGKNMFFNPIEERQYLSEKIVEIEPGIYYINMANCAESDFDEKIELLANAKAVIYDQRGGSRLQFFHIAPFLIDEPVTSAWWEVPQTIYPNRKEVKFDKSNWSIPPQQPQFKSKTILINVPAVVSSGETMMSILDHYKLVTTVGEPTAGCNGNVNRMYLPCGYSVWWTGMKVLKHDGSQLYKVGFQPDYPVNKTIQAIKDGRDEYLEKALEIAKGENTIPIKI